MRAESTVKPKKYKIENIKNGRCTVYFFANIKEETKEENTIYVYDMYSIELFYRENLQTDIEQNYDKWIEFAKEQEYKKLAAEVRKKRDRLLTETDWTQVLDTALNEDERAEYRQYRKKLRDITEQENFPYNIIWPVKGE